MKNKLTTKFLMSMFTWQTVAEKNKGNRKKSPLNIGLFFLLFLKVNF